MTNCNISKRGDTYYVTLDGGNTECGSLYEACAVILGDRDLRNGIRLLQEQVNDKKTRIKELEEKLDASQQALSALGVAVLTDLVMRSQMLQRGGNT